MRLRWTEPAVHDLTQICDYIEQHGRSGSARRVALSIYESVSGLADFPERGRIGRKPGTRELVLFACLTWLSIVFGMTWSKSSEFCMARRTGRDVQLQANCIRG